MTDSDGPAARTLRTRIIAALVGLAVIVVLAVVVTRLASDGSEEPQSGASPSATPEPTDATPTSTASPDEGGASPSGGADGSEGTSEEAPSDDDVDDRPPLTVSFDEQAQPAADLTVAVSRVEEVTSQAELPGETSRPALRLTVQVRNTGDTPVDLGSALTNLYFGPDRTPGSPMLRPGGRPFPQTLAAGRSAEGVFVYNVPRSGRGSVDLEVILDTTIRRVEFSGDCSQGC